MFHLFLEGGKSHVFEKTAQSVDLPPRVTDSEILYIYKDGVGFFLTPQMYQFIPFHRIKEIIFTKEAGQQWTH